MCYNDEIYEPHPISSIELLGYAKNDIAEVQEIEDRLPEKYRTVLTLAYNMLSDVQEYLYNN